jgi:hypothetical protein
MFRKLIVTAAASLTVPLLFVTSASASTAVTHRISPVAEQRDYAHQDLRFVVPGEHAWYGYVIEQNTGRSPEVFTARNYGFGWVNVDNHSYVVEPGRWITNPVAVNVPRNVRPGIYTEYVAVTASAWGERSSTELVTVRFVVLR